MGANYRYFRQLYSRQAEQRYQQSIEMAYRDLMNQYKEEVRVQQEIEQELNNKRKFLQDALKAEMKARTGKTTTIQKEDGTIVTLKEEGLGLSVSDRFAHRRQIEDSRQKVFDQKVKEMRRINEEIDASYEIPTEVRSYMSQTLANMTGKGSDLSQFHSDHLAHILPKLKGSKQAKAMYVEYGDQIRKHFTNPPSDIAALFGVDENLTQAQLDIDKQVEKTNEIARLPYSTATYEQMAAEAKGEKPLRKKVASTTQTTDKTKAPIDVQAPDQVGRDDTIKELEKKLKEFPAITPKSVAPPTREQIMAKAGEYYAPFGSKDFQARMGFMEQMKKEQPKPKEVAKQAVKASIPDYAKPMVGLYPQVKELGDYNIDDILENGTTGQKYAGQLLKQKNKSIKEMSLAIQNDEKLTPAEKEQAWIILGAEHYRKHKEKKQIQSME